MNKADKKVLLSAWNWLKYIMIPMTLIYIVYGELLFEYIKNTPYIVFVILMAIFNSMMDTVQHHFDTSVFRNLNPMFFNPNVSYIKKTYLGYRFDFWHLCKSAMVFCLAFSIVSYGDYSGWKTLDFWINFGFIGYIWNITFSLFYDIILRRK